MVRDPVMVDPDAPCGRLSRLMRNKGIGSVVVVKDGFKCGGGVHQLTFYRLSQLL